MNQSSSKHDTAPPYNLQPATDAGAAPAGEVSEPDIRPPAGTTDATSSGGSSNIGLIVGAVCGAVALVAVGVIAFVVSWDWGKIDERALGLG